MAILTTDEYRLFEATTLGDAALQILLDAAETEIVRYAGDPAAAVDWFVGGQRYLFLSRPAATITSIVEWDDGGPTSVTLDADDYQLWPGGYRLQRLGSGTNPLSRWPGHWHGRTVVTYAPADDEALRQAVQVDLIKLALNFSPGASSEKIGDWSETFRTAMEANGEDRSAILSRLAPDPYLVVVGG